jgi:hypothetical protein
MPAETITIVYAARNLVMYERTNPGMMSEGKFLVKSVAPVATTWLTSTPGALLGISRIRTLVNALWPAETKIAPPIARITWDSLANAVEASYLSSTYTKSYSKQLIYLMAERSTEPPPWELERSNRIQFPPGPDN